MTDVRRLVTAALVALTVVAALVVGDVGGGGDDEGEQAAGAAAETAEVSTDEFCSAFENLSTVHAVAIETTTPETVSDLRETAAGTLDVARRTPALGASAVEGLGYIVGLFVAIPDDADTERVLDSGQQPSVTEQARADDLADFLNTECFGSDDPAGTSPTS